MNRDYGKRSSARGMADGGMVDGFAPAAPGSGEDVGFWERFKAGNKDQPGSEAHRRWGDWASGESETAGSHRSAPTSRPFQSSEADTSGSHTKTSDTYQSSEADTFGSHANLKEPLKAKPRTVTLGKRSGSVSGSVLQGATTAVNMANAAKADKPTDKPSTDAESDAQSRRMSREPAAPKPADEKASVAAKPAKAEPAKVEPAKAEPAAEAPKYKKSPGMLRSEAERENANTPMSRALDATGGMLKHAGSAVSDAVLDSIKAYKDDRIKPGDSHVPRYETKRMRPPSPEVLVDPADLVRAPRPPERFANGGMVGGACYYGKKK